MKQSQASIKRSIKNLRMIIDSKTVDPTTKRMAYFAETTLRWAIEDTVDWQRPEVDLEDEVALLLKEVAEQNAHLTGLHCPACMCRNEEIVTCARCGTVKSAPQVA